LALTGAYQGGFGNSFLYLNTVIDFASRFTDPALTLIYPALVSHKTTGDFPNLLSRDDTLSDRIVAQARATNTLRDTRCVEGQQRYKWCDFTLGGGGGGGGGDGGGGGGNDNNDSPYIDVVPHSQKFWCPPHPRLVARSPWDAGPIGLRCVLDDGDNDMHMGVYFNNTGGVNKIAHVQDPTKPGNAEEHPKLHLAGFTEFFKHRRANPAVNVPPISQFNQGLEPTSDLYSMCNEVVLVVTDEFCYLWDTSFTEEAIKSRYSENNNRGNPLEYLGSSEVIEGEVDGGGGESAECRVQFRTK